MRIIFLDTLYSQLHGYPQYADSCTPQRSRPIRLPAAQGSVCELDPKGSQTLPCAYQYLNPLRRKFQDTPRSQFQDTPRSQFQHTKKSVPAHPKRESAVNILLWRFKGIHHAFPPVTSCRKARHHATSALYTAQPRFPSAAMTHSLEGCCPIF